MSVMILRAFWVSHILLSFFSSVVTVVLAFSPRLQGGRVLGNVSSPRSTAEYLRMSEKNKEDGDGLITNAEDLRRRLEEAKRRIAEAISIGAPAYNAGDVAGCARTYEKTAIDVVSLLPRGGDGDLRASLEAAIGAVDVANDPDDAAWTLRRRFDAIANHRIPFARDNDVWRRAADVKDAIARAISIGAPAYNAGDVEECARVYRETALDVLPALPSSLRTSFEAAIAADYVDANEAAWAFRRRFDAIAEYEVPFVPTAAASPNSGNVVAFESFSDETLPPRPYALNDNVMGGVSQGAWSSDSNTFRGNTSLANNGGFSSLRWSYASTFQNWSRAKGIYLKGVRHSNPAEHTFRIILKDTTCERLRGANFKTVFSNPNQTHDPIMIPFEAFDRMEQMGRPLPGAPVFDSGAVTELGLMAIKPTVVGAFELQIKDWGLYY